MMHIHIKDILHEGWIAAVSAVREIKMTGYNGSKVRIGIDIGAIIFMIGISFNAGIQYKSEADTHQMAVDNAAKIAIISENVSSNQLSLSDRMSRMEQLLTDIKGVVEDNQQQRNSK